MAYARFMVYFRSNVRPFPASDESLATFFTFQSQSCKYTTLKNYFYAIREFHLARGHTCPPLAERHMVQWTLQGIRRVRCDQEQPKQAMTLDILRAIYRVAVGQDVLKGNAHTMWAAMLVGFFGMLRKDNITHGKVHAAHPSHGLRRGDVCFTTMSNGTHVAWLRVRMAKNNVFGERTHLVPLVASGGVLCPVAALRQHIADFPAPPSSPLFLVSPAGGRSPIPLSHTTFVSRMKAMLAAAGHDPSRFAGHSLRRGGATLAFGLNCPKHLIQLQGDWLSDVVYRYHEVATASRLVLPVAMARAVLA
jgi:hypothetical protein